MNSDDYRLLERLFHEARALPASDRQRYLDSECADRPDLLATLESMLDQVDKETSLDELADLATIGPYRIVSKLGQGGMGEVFLAEQSDPVKRRVALKIIHPGMSSRQLLARFELERQALAVMSHSGITRIFDSGVTDDHRPYFAMELVEGLSLTEYCDRNRLSIDQRLALLARVCDAVQHAHQNAIIHRDLKPSNVLVVEEDGEPVPKIIDFGIAKALDRSTEKTAPGLTAEAGAVIGTPEYMSPEQLDHRREVDTRTDIYALGVIFYELVCGQLPVDGETLRSKGLVEMTRFICDVDAPRASERLTSLNDEDLEQVARSRDLRATALLPVIRGELDWIGLKAVEREPDRRYRSASDFADDLRRYLDHEPVAAIPPTAFYLVRKFVRRYRVAVSAVLAVLLALIVGLCVSLIMWNRSEVDRQLAIDAGKAEAEKTSELRVAVAERDQAILNKDHALGVSESLRLAGLASSLAETRTALSLPLAFAASKRSEGIESRSELAAALQRPSPKAFPWGAKALKGSAMSPDGRLIAYVWSPTVLCVRDVQAEKNLFSWSVASGVESVAFSPDSRHVAVAAKRGACAILSVDDGKPSASVSLGREFISDVKFSADGAILLARTSSGVRLIDSRSGKPSKFYRYRALSMQLDDRNQRLLIVQALTATLLDLETDEVVLEVPRPTTPAGARLAPDGMTLFVPSANSNEGMLYDAKNGETIGPLVGHEQAVMVAAYSADGKTLATGSVDTTVRVWSVSSRRLLRTLRGHGHSIHRLVFTPDGGSLLSNSNGYDSRLWSLNDGRERLVIGHGARFGRMAFSADGLRLFGSEDSQSVVWNLFPGAHYPDLPVQRPGTKCLSWSRGEERFAITDSEGVVELWDGSNYSVLGRYQNKGVKVAELSADGSTLAVVSGDGLAALVNTEDWKHSRLSCAESVLSLKLSNDGQHVILKNRNGVCVHEISSGELLHQVKAFDVDMESASDDAIIVLAGGVLERRTKGGESKVLLSGGPVIQRLAVSPVGKLAALSLRLNSYIQVVDTESGDSRFVLKGHTRPPSQMKFSGDGKILASASLDGTVRLWETVTGTEWLRYDLGSSEVVSLRFSADGRRLVLQLKNDQVRYVDVNPRQEADRRAVRSLSWSEMREFAVGDSDLQQLVGREERISWVERRFDEALEFALARPDDKHVRIVLRKALESLVKLSPERAAQSSQEMLRASPEIAELVEQETEEAERRQRRASTPSPRGGAAR